MQISRIKQKIAISSVITVVLISVIGFGTYYVIDFTEKSESKIRKINISTSNLKQESYKLESQAAEFKKYSKIWSELKPLKRKVEGIKSDKVNKSVSEIAKKYSIRNVDVKLNLPKELKNDVFSRSTIRVFYTMVSINFVSLTDINAMKFIYDFLNTLSGQKIISSISIKKDKDYSAKDFSQISVGKSEGNIRTTINIHWYAYEDK